MSRGISKAIREKGGKAINDELKSHLPLSPGDVVITTAGDLPARYVYHAVVVGWGDERRVLQASIWRSVTLCMELSQLTRMRSIAFPSLGTGSGGADWFETHSTMAAAFLESLRPRSSLRDVYFCFTSVITAGTFRIAFNGQRVLQQTRGLTASTHGEGDRLGKLFEHMYSAVLRADANADKLGELADRFEQLPPGGVTYVTVRDIINSTGIAIGPGAEATVSGPGATP